MIGDRAAQWNALWLYLFSAPVLVGAVQRLHHVWFGTGGDLRYLETPVLTTLHLGPGLLFFLLAPIQFAPRKRRGHRLRGRVFVLSGILSAIGVAPLVFTLPALGGVVTQVSTLIVVTAMMIAMILGLHAVRRRDIATHRAMMMRAYGLGLTVASARWLIHGAEVLGAPLERSFVVASVVGSGLTILTVEWMILRARRTELP